MSAAGKQGKAVQILRINNDQTFELNESELESILLDDKVKDKPAVVVSVAGAFRQGKSFLLAFFLRFLCSICHEGGGKNWLDDSSIPLGGFEWRPGSKRHTSGILLWNEAFLVTTPKGDEVAVLLMDTQGTFDYNSTMKECTTIFALSIMTSSVQVYNILRNIQEDHLQYLQLFSEYGRLAQQETGKTPFQRLVFLVRDWAFPYEADYGAEGGRTILKDRLEVTDKQHGDLQSLRRDIMSFFSQIDCFLMPRPGAKEIFIEVDLAQVETGHSFNGYLTDINEEFKLKMKELVHFLLAPENLVLKQINGQNITCEEFVNYFRVYARAFQGGTLPPPKSILQATAEASNMAAKERAIRFYLQGMDSTPRGNLEVLEETSDKLLKKATELFRRTPKVGDESVSHPYLEALEADILAHFDRIYKDEEQFLLREAEKEEQREREREEERKREEERQRERNLEKEKEEQWEKEMRELCERELESQKQIEELEQAISEAERDLNTTDRSELRRAWIQLLISGCRAAVAIARVVRL